MSGKFRWVKIIVVSLLIGAVLGGGITLARFALSNNPERSLKASQEAYQHGLETLQAGDAAKAAERFDEANLRASKAIEEVAKLSNKAPDEAAAAHLKEMEGQALWLRARALRDHAFARAQVDGQPLPETVDTVSGEKFRSMLALRDPQQLQDAVNSVRAAAARLPNDRDVLQEALRVEMMIEPMSWPAVEKLSRQIVQQNPQDVRARYLLARFEFEQPPLNGGAVPLNKRSRDRILKAREHIAAVKRAPDYPVWRTLFLEAQIDRWLASDAVNRGNSTDEQKENLALRSLLFHDKDGALARAYRKEGMAHLGIWDVQGLLGLYRLALGLAVEDSRKPTATTDKVVELLNTTLAQCRQLADKTPGYLGECALTAVAAVSQAQPALAVEAPAGWKKDLELVQELAGKARDQEMALNKQEGRPKTSNPQLYQALAELLQREAHVAGKRGDRERRTALRKQALQWIEDGLRLGQEAKLAPIQLAGLHMQAADMKAVAGGKPDEVATHLAALKEAKTPRALAMAQLIEAATAEREGRLDKARRLLEEILASQVSDLVLRAHIVLSGVYLAMGQPEKALVSLHAVEKAYDAFERLSEQEKAWVMEFIRGPEDLAVQLIGAHLDSALSRAARYSQQNPGKPAPKSLLEQIQHHEQAAQKLRKKLAPRTPQDRTAGIMLVNYYARTGKRDRAEEELNDLRAKYSDSVAVLRADVNFLILPPTQKVAKPEEWARKTRAEADKRIEQFLKQHPDDVDGRYFWVEWLMRTQRSDKAVAYLQDPGNFPGTKDERYNRVLAAALLGKGDQVGSMDLLRHLTRDPSVDALLIRMAATPQEQEKQVQEALARHESNGLFQTWQAVQLLNKRKYEEAADIFLRATEFTRFQGAARQGLTLALFALAQNDPRPAREHVARLMKEAPEEPLLLLASAYCYLLLDEIGEPADSPVRPKTMAGTLNAWEQLILKQKQSAVTGPLTKAEFWVLASRQDLARAEVMRALSQEPRNEAALALVVGLALDSGDPSQWPEAQRRLDVYKQIQPDRPQPFLLQAQLDQQRDKTAEAVKIYETLLKKGPKLSVAYLRLILALEKQGDTKQAAEWLRHWRKELPNEVSGAEAEVRQLAAARQFAEARRAADRFTEEQLERLRKQLADAKPRPKENAKELEKRKQAALDQARVVIRLNLVRGLIAAKAYDEALVWLRPLLEKQPDLESALVLKGEVYVQQKDWPKAREVYVALRKKNKHSAIAGNNLAWMLAKHFDEADKALPIVQGLREGRYSHKPISGDRLRPEFLDTLGVIYTKLGKGSLYPEMKETFEQARKRYPLDPRMCLYLGHAYAGLLETDKANEQYQAAIDLAADKSKKTLTPEKCKAVTEEARAAIAKLRAAR